MRKRKYLDSKPASRAENPPQNPNQRTILHVDMDAFFASVEQQTYPFLRGKPVGVCGNPNSRTVIAAASYEAKRMGVKTAMTIPEARRLCPEIILVVGNPAKYVDTSTRIVAFYASLTDLVEVFSIDEAFLDITQTLHLHKNAEEIAISIKEYIRKNFGLTCSIGIAPNKMLAKLASEMQKPDGLTIIHPEDVPILLEKTPVEAICGIGPKTKEKLNRLNIYTCADLGRYPESKLRAVFGVNAIRLHNIGLGQDESPVLPCWHEPETKSMGHSLTLERDTQNPEVIKRILLQLSEQVARRLRQESYTGRIVSLTLRYSDFTTHLRQRSLTNHIDDGLQIYSTAWKLFSELYCPEKLVRLLGVSVSGLIRNLSYQLQLSMCTYNEPLSRAIDIINERYGEFSIARSRLLDSSGTNFSGKRNNLNAQIPRVIPPSWNCKNLSK